MDHRRLSKSWFCDFQRGASQMFNINTADTLDSICNYILLVAILTAFYLLIEFHYNYSNSKQHQYKNLTTRINDISNKVTVIKNEYDDIEKRIHTLALHMPLFENQLKIMKLFLEILSPQEDDDTAQDSDQSLFEPDDLPDPGPSGDHKACVAMTHTDVNH